MDDLSAAQAFLDEHELSLPLTKRDDTALRPPALLLGVPELDVDQRAKAFPSLCGPSLPLRAPGGLRARLVERSPAVLAFERFRSLAGAWRGTSSQGWEDRMRFDVIARGSVVLETSDFEAHPGERMLSLIALDGSRLLLTHVCVAGNQPRLLATSFEDGGRVIGFEFLDATNLASRDVGHMDRALVRFHEDGRISTQWTWYQDGQERWLEEIVAERIGD